jgi:hypothetical protein
MEARVKPSFGQSLMHHDCLRGPSVFLDATPHAIASSQGQPQIIQFYGIEKRV